MNRRNFFLAAIFLSIFPIFYSNQKNQKLKIVDGWVLKSHDL